MNSDENRTFKESAKYFVRDAILATTGSAIIIVIAVLVAEFVYSLPK